VADLFPFVQLEFTHALGPDAGRDVIAGDEAGASSAEAVPDGIGRADLLLIQVVGARTASEGGIIRRRTRAARPEKDPEPVPLALAMLIRARARAGSERDAQALLRKIDSSEAEQESWIGAALDDLNQAIRAYRAAAVDPYVTEVTRSDPRRVRIGYGTGAEVYDGNWTAAITIPAPRGPRLSRGDRLGPTEAVAGVLSRRAFALDCEDLAMRALLDVDRGRTRAAAVQLRAAFELFWAEISNEISPADVAKRIEALRAREKDVTELAERGLREAADSADLGEKVTAVCSEMISLLTAWRYELLR
jgi:hypothetical protein